MWSVHGSATSTSCLLEIRNLGFHSTLANQYHYCLYIPRRHIQFTESLPYDAPVSSPSILWWEKLREEDTAFFCLYLLVFDNYYTLSTCDVPEGHIGNESSLLLTITLWGIGLSKVKNRYHQQCEKGSQMEHLNCKTHFYRMRPLLFSNIFSVFKYSRRRSHFGVCPSWFCISLRTNPSTLFPLTV
jgi:hypothetical protein